VVTIETVYHQIAGEQPMSVEVRSRRTLNTDEQPYQRKLTVGPEWQKLDTGWIVNPSVLVVSNEEGTRIFTNPTEDQRTELAAKEVRVGIKMGGSVVAISRIPPGESVRNIPVEAGNLWIRCCHGSARVIVTAFPE
jgi:hypothetical protein